MPARVVYGSPRWSHTYPLAGGGGGGGDNLGDFRVM